MDEVTWTALTAVLTALGAAWTFYAFRNRGVASGLRGAGLTLIPPAAYLTGTMEMFTEIGTSVAGWATSIALSPVVWAGIVCAGLSVLLLGTSSALRERGRGGAPAPGGRTAATAGPDGVEGRRGRGSELPTSRERKAKGEPALDDDLSDVEEILRRRGIT